MRSSEAHRRGTLWWCGVLHAFTHVYHVALLPLYLLIQRDLRLPTVERATLLVTIMMAAYYLPSYPLGALADRFSRKKLLATGLAINGAGFVGLALARDYATALICVVVAGIGGSFYHPAATAMVARLFPRKTGKALGLVGIGAGLGFFFGPIYVGWRASTSGWRAPVLELGLLGMLTAGLFAWLAEDQPGESNQRTPNATPAKMFPTSLLWLFFVAAAFAFSLRDFAGAGMASLGSLFLQHAHGLDPQATGAALSGIFVAAVISNPLFGGLSDQGRKRWTCFVLLAAAVAVYLFPRLAPEWSMATFAIYGFFFMGSYPTIEAALMKAVPDEVRGRVFGLFITVGGCVGNLSHWMVGNWVKRLGPAASTPQHYYPFYTLLAVLIVLSLIGLPCLQAIRRREESLAGQPMTGPQSPITTATPAEPGLQP